MQANEKGEFLKLVSDVHGYYRQNVSEFTLSVWWEACKVFDAGQVRSALTAHVMNPDTGQFLPKVADVVKVLQGTSTDRAAVAWGVVMQAIGAIGAYQDVDFGDPATHAAIHDLGGWPKVCRTELKELGYLQHRFTESYRAYTIRGVSDCPLVLTGDRSPDAEYERKGLPVPKVRLLGARHCAEVLVGAPRLASEATRRIEDGRKAA